MNKRVLVINAGSSTIKWTMFNKSDLNAIATGVADRIGIDGSVSIKFNGEKSERELSLPTHQEAVEEIIKDLISKKVINDVHEVENIGFRVVQGGDFFSATTLVEGDVVDKIEKAAQYAPLHNPGAVTSIRAFEKFMPDARKTTTFDTAFHTTIPAVNSTYAINQKIAKELGIKKYGAHGTSHRFITHKLEEVLNKKPVNAVVCHIGNGASLCAVKDSKSFDTSMGLTPLAGIMMGTRSGDIDPSIHNFIANNNGMTIQEIDDMLHKESGMLGVSGISSDLRDVESAHEKGDKQATLALKLYAQKIIDYTVQYVNKIGHCDAIVFTAGVGENSDRIRRYVVEGLPLLGLTLDKEANTTNRGKDVYLISTPESKIPVYVMQTDEELMIAKDALEV